ncbi:uncharacterized protein LOC129004473 [Macrosteles quadrilineatus]|uniref:uncharacterized protein LOC129004473 n=1 Tax=Macrosteles quadrilineatus TaxID=74068 RepID=UPI0023E260C0|nr:uncharacterized protein LOC129004473 [Macrosteles quadrilineatus]
MPPDMSRRSLYETAFDSRISKSDDDLDVDIVINKSILPGGKLPLPPKPGPSSACATTPERRKVVLSRQELVRRKPKSVLIRRDKSVDSLRLRDISVDSLTKDLDRVELHEPPLPLRGFAPPTPPSSAPLPTKFPSSHSMASVHSAPNLPGARLKDARLPIKSVRCRIEDARVLEGRPRSFIADSSEKVDEVYSRPKSLFCPEQKIAEIKSRPDSRTETTTAFLTTAQVLEIKGRPRRVRVKYSSTESMATSSSGGSLESIRSSTSEGNRSTSSSESHRSSSLSSHSSDSAGSTGYHNPVANMPTGSRFFHQKLHILSPISDKSSQEQGSETSENNKNNNSQKASPEENTLTSTTPMTEQNSFTVENPTVQLQKPKRRTPQNKNLINLGLGQCSGDSETHQGSDSGISIESRCGMGSSLNQNVSVDLNDLPFDMPKLRRRRLVQQPVTSVQDMSGSATSVDLRELPFDMPKLRRRLRVVPPSTESSGLSQASSSHSVQEPESTRPEALGRPSLTLDLDQCRQPRSLGLSLDLGPSLPASDIQVDLPLERQGWYHGAITRLEAENVLRHHDEGSYLVRNSESSRQDYSLSLKSARGFMHMRIQQCRETGKFILGQFSSPFASVPEMIRHYTVNRLPIRGAEHMCLKLPVIEQLL